MISQQNIFYSEAGKRLMQGLTTTHPLRRRQKTHIHGTRTSTRTTGAHAHTQLHGATLRREMWHIGATVHASAETWDCERREEERSNTQEGMHHRTRQWSISEGHTHISHTRSHTQLLEARSPNKCSTRLCKTHMR